MLGALALLLTNALGAGIPWLVKQAVDLLQAVDTSPEPITQRFVLTLALIALLSVVTMFVRITSRMWLLGLGRKTEYDFRNQLYGHLLKMPVPYFTANPPGELMSRLTNDVTSMRYLMGGGMMLTINTVFAYVVTIPMMLWLSPWLTLAAFLLYPLVTWGISRISTRLKNNYGKVQSILGNLSAEAQEVLSVIPVIQAFVKEPIENERFAGHAGRYMSAFENLVRDRVQMTLLISGLASLSTLVVLMVGGWQVIHGILNLGGFVAFSLYLKNLEWPTMSFGWAITIFQQAAASLERIDAVLMADPDAVLSQGKDTFVAEKRNIPGGLWIQDLSFRYENPYPFAQASLATTKDSGSPKVTGEAWGLEKVSLHVLPGQLVAVVGAIGSGKSTLLKMIPRIWEPSAGSVFWQGKDITSRPWSELRQDIGYMSQLGFLFSVSVANNIGYGKVDVSRTQVEQWAQMANIHNEVLGLPQGYDTLVGERGVLLSGGQRQRLALARTLLIEPKLLLLDDPFSSVDVDTEQAILSALFERQFLKERTTLIATHRFSVVEKADKVILMDAGRIVATGSHTELLETQPLYQRLYHDANQSNEPDKDDVDWSTQLEAYMAKRQARFVTNQGKVS